MGNCFETDHILSIMLVVLLDLDAHMFVLFTLLVFCSEYVIVGATSILTGRHTSARN